VFDYLFIFALAAAIAASIIAIILLRANLRLPTSFSLLAGFRSFQKLFLSRTRQSLIQQKPQVETSARQVEEAALIAVSEAQRLEELAAAYRDKLRADPQMSKISILTMSWSLDLLQVYVQLRLLQDAAAQQLAPEVFRAEMARDPDTLLKAEQMLLEQRVSKAIDPAEAIRRYHRCVILGDPGSGKTTLLKYLALRCADKNLSGLSDFPMYIDLNAFVHPVQAGETEQLSVWRKAQAHANPLLTFAAAQWERCYAFPAEDALTSIQRNLEAGNALVLLDGLDETFTGGTEKAADDSYNNVADAVRRLAETYTDAFIVVTARIAGYRQHVPIMDFAELEVMGFRAQDIERFIRNWFANPPAPAENSDRQRPLVRSARDVIALLSNPRQQALASNPLLLAQIMIIASEPGDLPTRRADLYKQCVDTLLRLWQGDRSRSVPYEPYHAFTSYDQEPLLEEIAWYYHVKGRRYFPEAELEQQILPKLLREFKRSTTQSRQVIEEISSNNGLLKQLADQWYGFLHLTLQEYFVALSIATDPGQEKLEELQSHVGEAWWEEIFLLYAGLVRNATRILSFLWREGGYDQQNNNQLADPFFHTHLIMAGQCLADSKSASPDLLSNIPSRLFEELVRSPYSLTRQQIAATLIQIDEQLPDSYLEEQSQEAVSQCLLNMLTDNSNVANQKDVAVKVSVGYALGTYGNEKVVAELAEILANEQVEPEIRIAIIQAIRTSGKLSVARSLARILPHQSIHHDVRLSAAAALSDLIDETVIPPLIAVVKNKRVEWDVRCLIIDALGASGNRAAVPVLYELSFNQEEHDFSLSWHKSIALAALGESVDLQPLLSLLANDKYSVEVRCSIANALAALHLPILEDEYLKLIKGEHIHWEVRASIAFALAALKNRSTVSLFYELATDESVHGLVRATLANILGTTGDRRMIAPLRRLKVDRKNEPYLYRNVIAARGKLGDSDVINQLLEWLEHQEKDISIAECLSMLAALAKLLGERSEAHERLINLAKSQQIHTEVRRSLIELLPQVVHAARTMSPPDEKYAECISRKVQETLVSILNNSDGTFDPEVIDSAHRALWTVRRYLPR
jgi:HEAT repeat protein/energy-coupling factor transporter ATP-binding protein EcfA2